MDVNAVILCAGKGTRMKSSLPKVVHKVCEYEMVNLVLKSLSESGVTNNTLVLGYKKDEVLARVDVRYNFDHVIQEEQLGTGHAIKSAKEKLKNNSGVTLVTYGDTPLVTAETYRELINYHQEVNNDITVLTAVIDDATGYGRIIRDDSGHVTAIVEQKDASEEQKEIKEFNSGIYLFDTKKLIKHLDDIDNKNAQKEYYLTDLVKIFNDNNYQVGAFSVNDPSEVEGVNDLVNLNKANKILQERINKNHLINGVNIIDISNTYISPNVIIGEGTTIEPGNYIFGNTVIGTNNHLKIGNYITDSEIKNGTTVGPNAHFRNNTVVGNNCRIGNYVEIKNSTLGDNTKAAHLSYLGDSTIGENVNFGCGVITANYDGVNKFKTIIGDNVFVGSNVNLIAPINVSDDVFIAAGTTVSKDIETDKFVIDRTDLRIKNRRRK